MGTTYRKIWQGPADGANCHPLTAEGVCTAAVRPGALCVRSATGIDEATGDIVYYQEPLVALEIGSNYGADINTDYEAGERVTAGIARSGEFYLVRCNVANLTYVGQPMISAGNGNLTPASTNDGSENILFRANEVINVTVAGTLVSMVKE